MLVKPKEILLKDGRVALLRNPNPDTDAAALIHHLWQIVSETEFLLRYPEGKTDSTGIIYEPWHYRYLGIELATEIHQSGLTVEQYLESLS